MQGPLLVSTGSSEEKDRSDEGDELHGGDDVMFL